jgi:peptidoglycan hydrolase CwlO-like protein
MISKTEIDQKFSAVKEHGEELAQHFKEFVQKLDGLLPDGVAKKQLVNSLQTASGWAHTALADGETELQKLSHQQAKSGEKAPGETSEAQGVAPDPALTNALDTKTDDTPPADTTTNVTAVTQAPPAS